MVNLHVHQPPTRVFYCLVNLLQATYLLSDPLHRRIMAKFRVVRPGNEGSDLRLHSSDSSGHFGAWREQMINAQTYWIAYDCKLICVSEATSVGFTAEIKAHINYWGRWQQYQQYAHGENSMILLIMGLARSGS